MPRGKRTEENANGVWISQAFHAARPGKISVFHSLDQREMEHLAQPLRIVILFEYLVPDEDIEHG